MKFIISTVITVLSLSSRAQISIVNRSLKDTSLNFLYIGVDNWISIGGYTKSYSLEIYDGAGRLTRTGPYEYMVHVSAPSDSCRLTLKNGTKILYEKYFKVVKFNCDPIATVMGLRDTTIHKDSLLVNPFLVVIIPGCYMDLHFSITAFSATFIQESDSIKTLTAGFQFSTEQVRFIKTLNPGDKIYFGDIRCNEAGSRTIKLEPFWLRIK